MKSIDNDFTFFYHSNMFYGLLSLLLSSLGSLDAARCQGGFVLQRAVVLEGTMLFAAGMADVGLGSLLPEPDHVIRVITSSDADSNRPGTP